MYGTPIAGGCGKAGPSQLVVWSLEWNRVPGQETERNHPCIREMRALCVGGTCSSLRSGGGARCPVIGGVQDFSTVARPRFGDGPPATFNGRDGMVLWCRLGTREVYCLPASRRGHRSRCGWTSRGDLSGGDRRPDICRVPS